jgi:hypothetical protein
MHAAMPIALITLVGIAAAATVLAVVFWLATIIFAPTLFFFVWHGPRPSTLAPIILAAIAPFLVGIPYGYAFGFLLRRRPPVIALLVALIAASLNVAHAVWAGLDLFGRRGWVTPLSAALLIALFTIAAIAGARAALRWSESRRNVIAGVALSTLTLVMLVGTYWWYESLLAAAGEADPKSAATYEPPHNGEDRVPGSVSFAEPPGANVALVAD